MREPQPLWSPYFEEEYLEEIEVELPDGGTIKLLNSTFRNGVDVEVTNNTTNAQESCFGLEKKDLKKVQLDLLAQGISTKQKPNFPAFLPRVEIVENAHRARRGKYSEAVLRAVPIDIDPNMRDGCKAFNDQRHPTYAARAYWKKQEEGVHNAEEVDFRGDRFIVFSTNPQTPLTMGEAEFLLELICLPPALDRHEGWLRSKGLVGADGHLYWTPLVKPFYDMQVVEVFGEDVAAPLRYRCLWCEDLWGFQRTAQAYGHLFRVPAGQAVYLNVVTNFAEMMTSARHLMSYWIFVLCYSSRHHDCPKI